MAERNDKEIIAKTRNTARFFTENRHISWVLLVAVLIWGAYSWMNMPKRKDPEIPVLVALAVCTWPGADAEKVEQLVTKPMEETIAQNSYLHEPEAGNEFAIKSTTLPGLAIVQVQLSEGLKETTQQFNDINLRLQNLNNELPEGAGPIRFNSGFGNTAAMMLTVASPKESDLEIELRAGSIKSAIERTRSDTGDGYSGDNRLSFVIALPGSVDPQALHSTMKYLAESMTVDGVAADIRPLTGTSFTGLDVLPLVPEQEFMDYAAKFSDERLGFSGFHIDAWHPVVITDPDDTVRELRAVDGDKYIYRDLENITELMAEVYQTLPEVSIIQRSGTLDQRVYLDYSQEVFASYGITPYSIESSLKDRNITIPGGEAEIGGNEIIVYPSGAFNAIDEIGGVAVTETAEGTPVYLRDLGQVVRGYQSPPSVLNYYKWRDDQGVWHRSRAVTLAVQMRDRNQIAEFGNSLDQANAGLAPLLPDDIIIAKTSDQPKQVSDNMSLFMRALIEAVILVVFVALIGFREWRSALLLAVSIPLTLAMTFGFAYLLGIELQQVSIASLIIALGLLVDDPVVANDAIKSNLAIGHPPVVSAWLGPTKLATAIMFATATNVIAYLPFLMITGTTGQFIYSLPIVLGCALIASRIVSMTFVPLLGYYLLRPKKKELSLEEKRKSGFTGFYYRTAKLAIDNRKKAFFISLVFFVIGGLIASTLKTSFFPLDVQYLSYVDIWMPNDATLSSTNETAVKAAKVITQAAGDYAKENNTDNPLESITSFIGAGSPRFWSTVTPEQQQPNYAQLVMRMNDKNDTPRLAPVFQQAVSEQIPGANIEVRQIQLNAVDYPIEIHLTGRTDINSDLETEAQDIETLRQLAEELKSILREIPETWTVRDDWFEDSFTVSIDVDPDRAALSGVTNRDVAVSTLTALSGYQFTTFMEGDKNIPVMARLRVDERSELSDLKNLYIYTPANNIKIPLMEVGNINYGLETSRIVRRNHFRAMTVIAYPAPGQLPSTILKKAEKQINEFVESLPPGYELIWGGEKAKQSQGFRNLTTVLMISVLGIFIMLLLQFRNAVKPLVVLAAVPYGMVGSLIALAIMGVPFGFMAFLGMVALVGVIVSHVIVLFDYIEEMHNKGEPFEESLLDAGIQRLRPILITVGATILALFPLAIEGGPLWQPLCYAQIGGLALATVIELVLVPVFYAIFIIDLKIIKWEGLEKE